MINSKVILITGCASGFGLLTASRLSAKYTVVATLRDMARSDALLSEVAKRGGQVKIFSLNVTKIDTIQKTVSEVLEKYGHIDVLINNAGYGIGGFFEDLTQDEIREQMETNFFGVQNVTRAVIPHMRERKRGRIINISSVAGFSTSPAFGAYNASKWALEAFSESLSYELKLFGIDVVLVEPGTYNTKIFHQNARYAKNFDDPKSPYFEFSQHLRQKVMNYVQQCRKDPEAVAILVERLVNADNPPFRNIPDIEAKALYYMRKFLPFKLYHRIISNVLFSGFKKPEL